MEYIGLIRLSIYSIELVALPMDIFKLEVLMISVVAEQEYQRIYKRYISSIIDMDIRKHL